MSLTVMFAVMLVVLSAAGAVGAAPVWRLDSTANTIAVPGSSMTFYVQVQNVGDAAADGSPVVFTAHLPAGMTAVTAGNTFGTSGQGFGATECHGPGGSGDPVVGASTLVCETTTGFLAAMQPRDTTIPRVTVDVNPLATGTLTATFEVAGGGASEAGSISDSSQVGPVGAGFGVDAFDGRVVDSAGATFDQAGGHPYAISTMIDFNRGTSPNPFFGEGFPVEPIKDAYVDLPLGFIGNPAAVGRCTAPELANSQTTTELPLCTPSSQIGRVRVFFTAGKVVEAAVYNIVPPPDVPARFGFNVAGTVVLLDGAVGAAPDYKLSVKSSNITEALAIAGVQITLWGVPTDSSHDAERACAGQRGPYNQPIGPSCASDAPRVAFLRNPTSCTAEGVGLKMDLRVDSWTHPGVFKETSFTSHEAPGYPLPPADWGPQTGSRHCDKVPFTPTLKAAPLQSARAGAPSAFKFDLSIPQGEGPEAIGESDLKRAIVGLPEGVRVNPSSADGLDACSLAQIDLHSASEPTCPDASKLGTVTIDTPLLRDQLSGSIYLAKPHDNPTDSLLAMYIVVKGPGFVIKQFGQIVADPMTGHLTATFDDIPQLPFSNLHLQLFSGPRAPLVTPSQCGTYTTHVLLTGWNGKVVSSDSHFSVNEGSNGGACSASSFAPALTAGTANPVAGAFSPLALRLERTDADSEFNALSLNLPPGLLADLRSVPVRCSDAQAAAAACPADSHIGTVTVGAGAGSNPFYVNGDVYLTGPYKGGPFGIAVVVRAQAGPFDLGNVVVRAALHVHSNGSATTVTDPFPQILQGIPLQVRDIRVNIDRAHFILNPTNCATMGFGGLVSSTDGQTAGLASRFQVGECAALAFHPTFKVSTQAKTSKANGASLNVKVTSGQGQANLAKTIVTLPKQLPARLTTIQKACPQETFAANPATCPAASAIGIATATTPILASPVMGPAYLVSHGGAAFPDVVLILQGEGVTVNVVGGVNIRKSVTTASFNRIPDVPISVFELKLPTGPHSGLGANLPASAKGSMCGQSLTMPTTLTGQNGAQVKQNTKIAVTGCPRPKKAKHKATGTKKKHTRGEKHTRGGKRGK